MTPKRRARATPAWPSPRPPGAAEGAEGRPNAEGPPDEAITPTWLPLGPMILTDAIGDADARGGASARPGAREAAEAANSVLTVDELAALLRVERKTVYAAIRRGEIPGVRRIGSVLRASRGAVLDWLAQGQGRVSRSRRSP